MEIEIRHAKRSDVDALKDRLRREDNDEVLAAGDPSAEAALVESYETSIEAFTVQLGSIPVAMFGIRPETLMGEKARVWFLGADEMAKIKKTFMRESRRYIDHFLSQYPILWNIVDGRYKSSLRWLRWCGAEFGRSHIHNGVEFHPFIFRRA